MATYKVKSQPLDTDQTSYTFGNWVHDVSDPVDGYALVWRQDYNVSYVIGNGNGVAARLTNDPLMQDRLPLGVGLGLVPPTDTIFYDTPQLAKPIVPGTLVITATSVSGRQMTTRDTPVSIEENRGRIGGNVEPYPRNMLRQDGVSVFLQNTVNYNRAAFFFQFDEPIDPQSPVTVSYKTSGLRFEDCCGSGGRTYTFPNGTGTRVALTNNASSNQDEVRIDVELDDIIGVSTGVLARDANGNYAARPSIDISPAASGTSISIDANGNVGIGTTTPSAQFEVGGDITIGTDANGNQGSLVLNGRTISDIDTEVTRVLNTSSIATTANGDVEFSSGIRVSNTASATAGSVRYNTQESRVEAHTGQRWIEIARDGHHGRTSNTRTPGQAIPVSTVTSSNSPYTISATDGLIVCDGGNSSITLNLPNPSDYSGTWFQIKDKSGNLDSGTTITLTPPNGILLDGSQNSYVIDIARASVGVVSTGTEWLIF